MSSPHEFRAVAAARESPRALLWTGLLILVMSVLAHLAEGQGLRLADVLHLVVVVVFLGGAWLTSRPDFPPALVPWVVSLAALSMVVTFQVEVVLDPTALGMAYVLIGMLAFGAFTLDVWATVVAGALMLVGYVVAARAYSPDEWPQWVLAAFAVLGINFVLLRVRLTGIDALGELTLRVRETATVDPLTGVLNRRGVEQRMPEVISGADRANHPVFAAFVDVDGLKAANDSHGHEFGDAVLRAVAAALRGTVRAGDVVGRWGGDEFIVVGAGEPAVVDHLADRLRERILEGGMDEGKWPAQVSVGVAVAPAANLVVDTLLAAADADMYRRRTERRA